MKRFMVVAALLGAFGLSSAQAGLSATGGSGETNFRGILDNVYGGTFAGADFGGASYTNGVVTATRVNDFGMGGPLNLSTGGPGAADDQVWQDGVVEASAHARFAGFSQKFGWDPDADGGFVELFDVSGSGFGVSGSLSSFTLSSNFAFARSGDNGPHYSKDSLNADGRDHMLTYEITGAGGRKTWLLFFEDKNEGQSNADFDYNDLVVELVVVPVPGAALLGTLGVGAIGLLRRRLA